MVITQIESFKSVLYDQSYNHFKIGLLKKQEIRVLAPRLWPGSWHSADPHLCFCQCHDARSQMVQTCLTYNMPDLSNLITPLIGNILRKT